MWGKKKIAAPSLNYYKFNITPDEILKLEQNWEPSIEDEKLVLSPSKEAQETLKQIHSQSLKDEINNAKNIDDIKLLLTQLIDL